MKRISNLLVAASFALAGATSVDAQDHAHGADHAMSGESKAVMGVVDALFDAMRAADGDAVRSLFTDDARLMSAGNRNGTPFVNQTAIESFAGAVAGATKDSWDERIWDVSINVNGNLATAWTPYAFYHDGNFSHCGVNAFQLVKMGGGWKILQLTDTRQREGCDVPDAVRNG